MAKISDFKLQLCVVAAALAVVVAQDATTQDPGMPYGSFCNGLVQRCNRYQETVVCMHIPFMGGTCETGVTVDVGKCQCKRNCDSSGHYKQTGEFNETLGRCVGLVGATCTESDAACTAHASCNFQESKCVCTDGYKPTSNGYFCTPIVDSDTQTPMLD